MQSRRRTATVVSSALLAAALVWAPVGAAAPTSGGMTATEDGGVPIGETGGAYRTRHAMQHGSETGHLPPGSSNVELVGKMNINQDEEARVADVGVLGDFAYLAAWGAPRCQKGGVYVFDISNPAAPKQINFIRAANDSYVGEGVQAISLSTMAFTGDLLAVNHEDCLNNAGKTSQHHIGGFSLYDISNPKSHKTFVTGFGDVSNADGSISPVAHSYHSVFVWEDDNFTATDADDRAYLMATDNEEFVDVDIFDITDPRNPVMVAEYDLVEEFPQIVQPNTSLVSIFLHDMVVKKIGNRYEALISYWDGGYVKLNVNDPAAATYIADSDYAATDPLLFERTGTLLPPEGNGHQAEFNLNNQFIIATDEDFDPYKLFMAIGGGLAQPVNAGTATGPQLGAGDALGGPTTFLGLGCTGSPIPAAGAGTQIAVIERGVCPFQEKIDNATAAGYDVVFIFNNEAGVPGCEALLNMLATVTIPAYFVSRSVGFEILGVAGYNPANCPGGANPALPAVGTAGLAVDLSAQFDGWGYVHLFQNGDGKLVDLDQYAPPEAHDADYAFGFGDLSVHEVATSHVDPNLAYLSYYGAGFRVVRIDPATGTLSEVGHFIDEGGNNFWGVQVWQKDGKEYVLASDRDYGLYIFEYTGP